MHWIHWCYLTEEPWLVLHCLLLYFHEFLWRVNWTSLIDKTKGNRLQKLSTYFCPNRKKSPIPWRPKVVIRDSLNLKPVQCWQNCRSNICNNIYTLFTFHGLWIQTKSIPNPVMQSSFLKVCTEFWLFGTTFTMIMKKGLRLSSKSKPLWRTTSDYEYQWAHWWVPTWRDSH